MPISWNKYPYTDFHEMNLDWALGKVKELTQILNDGLEQYLIAQLDDLFADAVYDPVTETITFTLTPDNGGA